MGRISFRLPGLLKTCSSRTDRSAAELLQDISSQLGDAGVRDLIYAWHGCFHKLGIHFPNNKSPTNEGLGRGLLTTGISEVAPEV